MMHDGSQPLHDIMQCVWRRVYSSYSKTATDWRTLFGKRFPRDDRRPNSEGVGVMIDGWSESVMIDGWCLIGGWSKGVTVG